jgi:uncharacterized SAM-binding protein YcdF (DUF218 family)
MVRAVPFDALVVLGCRVDGDRLAYAALRRVEEAARVYAAEGAGVVIASGGKRWEGRMECEVFARGLIERGVPAERVLQERESLTTRGNALGTARLLRGRAQARLGVVTCDWHMPRALGLFRRAGLLAEAVPAPSPERSPSTRLLRFARERGAMILELVRAPFWPRS